MKTALTKKSIANKIHGFQNIPNTSAISKYSAIYFQPNYMHYNSNMKTFNEKVGFQKYFIE